MSWNIEFFRESEIEIPLEEIDAKQLISSVMKDLGRPDFSINIISMEDEDLREMKKEYFQQDVYTDIISFTIEEEPLEGELYISPERIRQNAEKFDQSIEREFARVLIHGACHLCGYNDISEDEKTEMTALENRFLTQYYDN
jgi:probable rRNA maturation factor